MKILITAILILTFSLPTFCQTAKYIRKAEKAIKEKKYDDALTLLERAQPDYGFCGTEIAASDFKINELKLKIYKESDKSNLKFFLETIDPIYEFSTNTYSMERLVLASEIFGKEELNSVIVNSLKKTRQELLFDINLLIIQLTPEYNLKLRMDLSKISDIEKKQKLNFNDALAYYYLNSEYHTFLTN